MFRQKICQKQDELKINVDHSGNIKEGLSIRIIDINGNLVYEGSEIQPTTIIPMNDKSNGVYLMDFTIDGKKKPLVKHELIN